MNISPPLPQIQLGSEDYLFPHLALLSSRLEEHSGAPTLSSPPRPDPLPLLAQRRPTATETSAPNTAMASTTSRSTHPVPSVAIEKLPSFIQVWREINKAFQLFLTSG